MVKEKYVWLLFIVIITGWSCKDVRKEIKKKLLPAFSVNIPPIKFSIPPLAFVSDKEVPVGALRTPINLDSTIRAHTAGTFGAAAVTSVEVKRIVLKLANADTNNNLSNFESGRMRIYSDTAETDIANIHFPEKFTDSLSVTPALSPDISDYLCGSQLAYNLFWKNRRPTSKFLKLTVQVTLRVQLTIHYEQKRSI